MNILQLYFMIHGIDVYVCMNGMLRYGDADLNDIVANARHVHNIVLL